MKRRLALQRQSRRGISEITTRSQADDRSGPGRSHERCWCASQQFREFSQKVDWCMGATEFAPKIRKRYQTNELAVDSTEFGTRRSEVQILSPRATEKVRQNGIRSR